MVIWLWVTTRAPWLTNDNEQIPSDSSMFEISTYHDLEGKGAMTKKATPSPVFETRCSSAITVTRA